jgi:ribosomal protein S18 acetylase RimI-like enzyme
MGEHEIMWLMDGRAFARWRAVPDIGEAELLRMAVAPGHRRSGLARLLMESCTKYLAECGCASLRLEARSSNVPAQRLYESLGWRQAGARRAYYGDGEDALLYALEL